MTYEAIFEALIFASPQPVSLESLAETTGISQEKAQAVLARLETRLATGGLRLQRHKRGGGLQLVTAPGVAPYVEQLLDLEVTLRLSQAALETLAIVAYAQPITRPQIEAIRGVSSDNTLRKLVSAGLVEEVGRADSVGRPILYGTTFEFLQQFGLEKVEDMPPLESPDNKTDKE
ncbi:MAG: SMC-Scp complex subunit ScpB [Anaerolineae bacterium]|nr:SMC-Scp complex subunit ScpB [Anaerolineae bacterium]